MMDSSAPFYYFPNLGNRKGEYPVFYYPGPSYTVIVVDEMNKQLYPNVPSLGKFVYKSWKKGDKQMHNYIPYSEVEREQVHFQLKTIFDQYKQKFAKFMENFDTTNVPEEDIKWASWVNENNPQCFYYETVYMPTD